MPSFSFAELGVEETARTIDRAFQSQSAIRVRVNGASGSGRRTFAAAVAACFSMETLAVDTSKIEESDWRIALYAFKS